MCEIGRHRREQAAALSRGARVLRGVVAALLWGLGCSGPGGSLAGEVPLEEITLQLTAAPNVTDAAGLVPAVLFYQRLNVLVLEGTAVVGSAARYRLRLPPPPDEIERAAVDRGYLAGHVYFIPPDPPPGLVQFPDSTQIVRECVLTGDCDLGDPCEPRGATCRYQRTTCWSEEDCSRQTLSCVEEEPTCEPVGAVGEELSPSEGQFLASLTDCGGESCFLQRASCAPGTERCRVEFSRCERRRQGRFDRIRPDGSVARCEVDMEQPSPHITPRELPAVSVRHYVVYALRSGVEFRGQPLLRGYNLVEEFSGSDERGLERTRCMLEAERLASRQLSELFGQQITPYQRQSSFSNLQAQRLALFAELIEDCPTFTEFRRVEYPEQVEIVLESAHL